MATAVSPGRPADERVADLARRRPAPRPRRARRLAVIGHDDAPLAAVFEPRLSTVRVDSAGLGRYLAQVTVVAAEGRPISAPPPESKVILVPRASTEGARSDAGD